MFYKNQIYTSKQYTCKCNYKQIIWIDHWLACLSVYKCTRVVLLNLLVQLRLSQASSWIKTVLHIKVQPVSASDVSSKVDTHFFNRNI
jgi:hypothetical protein